jgi:putative hydrolase of the HAD superfamily
MTRIEAVISDFGGVLTSPLIESYAAVQESSGVPLEALGKAMAAIMDRDGSHPLFELETGRLSETQFLDGLSDELTEELGRPVSLHDFGDRFFENLHPNERMLEFMRGLRDQGYKLGICTNNVREWEPLWRAKLPVDEIFSVVVDSAFVGSRKPEPRIYEITLESLGVPAQAALLIDDIEVNCSAARDLGMRAVWFRDTDPGDRGDRRAAALVVDER